MQRISRAFVTRLIPLCSQVLSINSALSIGYKHVVLFGLSGGGWSTTVAAAIDPRISLSIPIAGSVPKFPTELYATPFSQCRSVTLLQIPPHGARSA